MWAKGVRQSACKEGKKEQRIQTNPTLNQVGRGEWGNRHVWHSMGAGGRAGSWVDSMGRVWWHRRNKV